METPIYQIIAINLILTEQTEKLGLGPIKEILKSIGGWPVLEGDKWNKSKFTWMDIMYKLIVPDKVVGVNYFMELSVERDIKDFISNILYVSYSTLIQYYSIQHKTIKYRCVAVMCRVLNYKHFRIHTVYMHATIPIRFEIQVIQINLISLTTFYFEYHV